MKKQLMVPSGISSLRIAALPLFLYFFTTGASNICLIIFTVIVFSDLLDGAVARKFKVESRRGAYFDAATDFIFITGAFSVFVLSNYYSSWMLFLIGASFVQFVLSSHYTKKLYDPLGKYLGSALYLGIGLTLACPTQVMFAFVQYAFLIFASISFITRIASFADINKKHFLINEKNLLKSTKTHNH